MTELGGQYLRNIHAMDELGLGIHEHAPYDRIDYRVFGA